MSKTVATQNGVAFSVDLTDDDGGCGRVRVFARVEVWVRVSADPALAQPGADPAPAAGSQADYVQILANEYQDFDLNQGILPPSAPKEKPLRKLVGWAKGAGNVMITGN